MKDFGGHSMTGALKRVIVKRPEEAFLNDENVSRQWKDLNYLDAPQYKRAVLQHRKLVELLESSGAEVLRLPVDDRTTLDSIYVHDPAIVTDAGMIAFQTGKNARRGEGPAIADAIRKWNIPVLAVLDGACAAEGGDMVWLDSRTLLVGRGFRTNANAVSQLRALLREKLAVDLLDFDLPYNSGPHDVLHLMSFLSMLDHNLAVVYRKLMPVALFELLQKRGVQMVDVADEEYETLGCNILATGPRQLLMVSGNPGTRARLEAEGCTIQEFEGSEIALKGSGGPTCLTRPLLRD